MHVGGGAFGACTAFVGGTTVEEDYLRTSCVHNDYPLCHNRESQSTMTTFASSSMVVLSQETRASWVRVLRPTAFLPRARTCLKDDVCLEQGSAAAETEQRNNDLLVVCTLAAVLQLVTYNRT